jgi:hypothetical protein
MQKSGILPGKLKHVEWRTVLEAVWLPALLWVLALGVPTLAGIPGIICITPLIWFSSMRIGRHTTELSSHKDTNVITYTAGLAGALFGSIEGVAFAVIYILSSAAGAQELSLKVMITIIMFLLSVASCAFLAVWSARIKQRQTADEEPKDAL